MPALTVDTTTDPQRSRSRSPPAGGPPMSPITPPSTTMEPPAAHLSHATHPSQASTTTAPPPEPIDFSSNTDAIALQSTLSILAIQRQRAEEHIRLLASTKDGAKANPEQTAEDLAKGDAAPWKDAFKPQSVARSPNVNWDKYAIVGESLDKIAGEQASHPPETRPSVWMDGRYQEQLTEGNGGRGEEYKGAFSTVSPFEHQREKEKEKGKKW